MKTDVMKIPDLLAGLAGKDIKVWVEDDRLRCNAPAGALTPEFRDQLRDRKSEIIGFLNMAAATTRQQPAIVPLQSHGTRTPIYAVPGHVGAPSSFSDLSKHLGDDQPLFALQPPGLDEQSEPMDRVEDIAQYFADQILEYQSTGPCIIAGYCSGASTAVELARLLDQRGAEVRCLVLFGPLHPCTYQVLPRLLFFQAMRWADPIAWHLREVSKLPSFGMRLRYFSDRLWKRGHHFIARLTGVRARKEAAKADPMLTHNERLKAEKLKATATTAVRRYTPTPYRGRVCMFLPNKAWVRSGSAPLQWLRTMPHTEVYYGPRSCYGPLMLQDPDAPAFAELYRQALRRVETSQ